MITCLSSEKLDRPSVGFLHPRFQPQKSTGHHGQITSPLWASVSLDAKERSWTGCSSIPSILFTRCHDTLFCPYSLAAGVIWFQSSCGSLFPIASAWSFQMRRSRLFWSLQPHRSPCCVPSFPRVPHSWCGFRNMKPLVKPTMPRRQYS